MNPSILLRLLGRPRFSIVLPNQGMNLRLTDEGRLDDTTRAALTERLTKRLEAQEAYAGKHHRLRGILQMQARHVATFLRGEGPYTPFVGRW